MRENTPELTSTTITLMVVVALFYDAVQVVLSWIGVGWLIMPVFYLHFWMWFRFHGMKFFTMKRAKGLGVGGIIEFLTAGIAPAFFINVLIIALDYKIKEKVPFADKIDKIS